MSMRISLLVLVIIKTLSASSQLEVSSSSPNVFVDSRKFLYLDAENPVFISTGKFKSVKVSMINGIIKKSETTGKYLATPDVNSFHSTIILEAKNFKQEFNFDHKELPVPRAFVVGPRNEDGVILYFKSTSGVMAFIENFPIQVQFAVDSFIIAFSDSISERIHMNIGAGWDDITKQMMNEMRRGTFVYIYNVHVSGLRRKYLLTDKITSYVR